MPLVDMMGAIIGDQLTYPAPEGASAGDRVIVPLKSLLETPDVVGPVAVALAPNAPLDQLVPFLDRIAVIAIEFPKFRDGRGFTTAHVLRHKYNYLGELRAVGHVIPDQLPMLKQCGFTTILTSPQHPPEQWSAIATERAKPHPNQLLNRRIARNS